MTTHRKTPRYSFLANLFVLTLVFALVFVLQHSKHNQTENTIIPVEKDNVAVKENIQENIVAQQPEAATTTESEKEYLPIPTTQADKIVVKLSKNKKEAKETKSENITFTEIKSFRTIFTRELSVEILDGETARQHYLAANKTGLAKNALEPKKDIGDFIPFEK